MKTVTGFDPRTMTRHTLATFTLDGERVVASYFDADYRHELEAGGSFTSRNGNVFPRDGRAFYDVLELAYSLSSFRGVVVDADG